MTHARMCQLDEELSWAGLGRVEGFDLGAEGAGFVVDGGLVLFGDVDLGGRHCELVEGGIRASGAWRLMVVEWDGFTKLSNTTEGLLVPQNLPGGFSTGY